MGIIKPTKFTFEYIEVLIPLDEFRLQELKKRLPQFIEGEDIRVDNIIISREGIVLQVNNMEIVETFGFWDDFLKSIVKKPYLFQTYEGIECEKVLKQLESWKQKQNAEIAVCKLKNSETSVAQLVSDMPTLFCYEPLKSYLSDPKNHKNTKKGKPVEFHQNEYQLYMYANHYYVHDFCSYEEACFKAIENHPELIPKTWKTVSADQTLRTRITNKYDAHPELSQKSYRKKRNTM